MYCLNTNPSVFIVDSDDKSRSELCCALSDCGLFSACTEFSNAGEAISALGGSAPDIIFLEPADSLGIALISAASQLRRPPSIIALSDFSGKSGETFAERCRNLGVDSCMPKPCDCEAAIGTAFSLHSNHTERRHHLLRIEGEGILCTLGFSPHLKGYEMLREGFVLLRSNNELIHSVTKVLYPMIAQVCHCPHDNVERNMRTAIDSAWANGAMREEHVYKGVTINPITSHPSPLVLLSTMLKISNDLSSVTTTEYIQ